MFDEQNITYEQIKSKATCGDPLAMYELAMLYDCGAIPSSSDEDYIYWLKKFFFSSQVEEILKELDDEDGEYTEPSYDFIAAQEYYPKIIETGIALGLYYKNSSNLNDVKLALDAFDAAFLVSRFDYIEVVDSGDKTDIVSLLAQTSERIASLSKGANNNA